MGGWARSGRREGGSSGLGRGGRVAFKVGPLWSFFIAVQRFPYNSSSAR